MTRKPGRPVDVELQSRRREQILEGAANCFAEAGYNEVDTQRLADQLEISKGTLFRYFPTKRELFLATIERAMHQLRDTVDATVCEVVDPLEQIRVAIRAYLQFFDDHPAVAELLMQERVMFKYRKSTYFEHKDQQQDDRWPPLLMALMDQGRLRRMPVERIRNVISDLVYGTVFSNHMSGRQRSCDEQAHDLIDVVFLGILSPEERTRHTSSPTDQ